MDAATVKVKGLTELLRGLDKADHGLMLEVRGELRHVASTVSKRAEQRFQRYDVRTAAGFYPVATLRGMAVQQRLRKTTGNRPDWGRLQMRKALLPALDESADEVEKGFRDVLDDLNANAGLIEALHDL